VLLGVLALLLFPDPFVNRFIKPRITKGFAESYPAHSIRIADMHYNVFKNRVVFDSVAMSAVDSTWSGTVGSFSASGIGWMHLLFGGHLAPVDFASSVVEAQDVVLNLPRSQYELRCGLLRVSVADSEILIDALRFHPSGDDEQFFSGSTFRQTRFRLVVQYARALGCACLELLRGKTYRTRSVDIHEAFLDVLINKDKAFATDTSRPLMPDQMLSAIGGALHIDSMRIKNGRLKYGERFAVRSNPALITIDSLQVVAGGIANHGDSGSAIVIRAEGNFMKVGAMQLRMSIPITSPNFSYQYSGSLSGMDATALNPFLETAEQMRLKTGVLQAATFEVNVVSGRASGNVRAIYRDLTLAAINKQTGSETGFADGITSFIANTFKIRKTNVPDQSGSMKVGEVKYTRKGDEFFLEFTWFALRSGLGDVVGF
jgi:hypothetical protein